MSIHMSKCQIVGKHVSRLIYTERTRQFNWEKFIIIHHEKLFILCLLRCNENKSGYSASEPDIKHPIVVFVVRILSKHIERNMTHNIPAL